MNPTASFTRRQILKTLGTVTLLATSGLSGPARAAEAEGAPAAGRKGRIKQGITRGCLRGIASLDEMAAICAELGIAGIDFVAPKDFPVLQKHGLICPCVHSGKLTEGLNNPAHHAASLASLRQAIDDAAAAGYPNVLCFSGNRAGIDDETGLRACTRALEQVIGLAEQKGVTICMELLNSKRDHRDYQCDRTAWGVELCKRVNSPRFKLLYDIYHMQIMEGDVISTFRTNVRYIGHVHTAGVPGRNEIDETQELYYPAIIRAIAESGYAGYVSHEYGPKRNPVESLRRAVELCDV
ncbi:hydroxypyruvate isomerase family protein [Opitutus terrae]|uniref:Xylose isomerase domain protein TIM barrel n=1 Tax=Opitutus terrae (strain DSM 11246 / JCM 15787 / PB90-1) TaxID=452637 RepID=B1ZYT4_OPITP|nr:TIM barrel protein [Opitutus terrae]ACB76257.1 Xylose isomerase domain protein TIM barrel [Opitutus terrae PB90-1]